MDTESAEPRDFREIDRFDLGRGTGGVGWIADPEESLQRASHALAVDGEVWVIDPVDAPGIDDLVTEFGKVAGVALLLDRHKRDAAAIARRHDVAVHLPWFMDGVADDLDAATETFRDELGDTGYAVHEVVNNRVWQEAALYSDDTGVLVVPEAVGTTDFFCVPDERLGVHVGLRLTPPTSLARLSPARVLVGHGDGVHEDATVALRKAVRGSRRRAPRMWAGALRMLLPF
ncbi:MAG: hypothetical protein V5A24_05525 [Haloarculaceae archaeon]